MAVLVFVTWPEATREQYEQVRGEVDWANMRPAGANLHMSSFDGRGGLHVVDHWDLAEQFQASSRKSHPQPSALASRHNLRSRSIQWPS